MVGGVGGAGGPGGGRRVGGPGAPDAPDPGAPPKTEAPGGTSFSDALQGTDAPRGAEHTVTAPTAPTTAADISPLERLRRGEIDLASYVEARVRDATAHLDGVLPAEDIEKIRADLGELIENDPDVAALVKTAEQGT